MDWALGLSNGAGAGAFRMTPVVLSSRDFHFTWHCKPFCKLTVRLLVEWKTDDTLLMLKPGFLCGNF